MGNTPPEYNGVEYDSESDDEYSIVEQYIEYDSESDDEFLPQMQIKYTKTIVTGDDIDQAKQEVDLSKVTYSEPSESKQTTVETLSNTVWPDDHINAEELEDVQLFMLSEYATRNGLTSLEKENLLYILVSIGAELKSEETLILTKVLLYALIIELEDDIFFTSGKMEEFLARMLNCANILGFAYSSAMEQCLSELLKIKINDQELQRLAQKGQCLSSAMEQCLSELLKIKINDLELQRLAQEGQYLSTYDRFRFLQSCCALNVPLQDQKHILHLVQVHQIPYHKLEAAFDKLSADPTPGIRQLAKELIDNEQQKSVAIVLNDTKKKAEIEDEVLEEVEAKMSLVDTQLSKVLTEERIEKIFESDSDKDDDMPKIKLERGLRCTQNSLDELKTHSSEKILNSISFSTNFDDYTKVVSQYTSKAVKPTVKVTDKKLAVLYSEQVAHDDYPASFLELHAIASGKEGHGIIVHKEVDEKFMESVLIPGNKPITNLLYTPPKDDQGVGHYDALVNGEKILINSDRSNCLYHAVAYTRNTSLTPAKCKAIAQKIRQEVSEKIASEPKKWSKLIKCRKRLEEIKGGKQLAMIGAGKDDFDQSATIIPQTYTESLLKDSKTVKTKYKMKNGVATISIRKYDKKMELDVVKNKKEKKVTNEVRMTLIEANVTGLMFVGKRTPQTQPIPGMINRHITGEKKKMQDSEVTFHGAPSCAGMGAGQGYATTLITSKKYNDREKTNWTGFKKNMGEGHKFSMWFKAETDRITNIGNAEEYIKKINKQRESNDLVHKSNAKALEKRLALMEEFDPRIYRVKSYKYCYSKGTEILKEGDMGEDFELGVPKRFNKPNQPAQLKDEFTKAKKKVVKHMINKTPIYNPRK